MKEWFPNPSGVFFRIFSKSFLLGFFFLVLQVEASGQDVFYLRPRVVLESSSIPLSKIVVLPKHISDREFLKTPSGPMTLTPSDVQKLLPSDLSHFQVLGGNCEILPLNLHFSTEELQDSLEKEIIRKNHISPDEYRVTYLGEDIKLPGEVELRWASFPQNLSAGSRIFSLNAWKENKKLYSARLKYKIEKKVVIAVAKKSLKRFSILGPDDVEMKTMYLDESESDFVNKDPIGLAVLSALEEGTYLRKKHVRLVHAVEKGMEVETSFSAGNLTVRGRATAKEAGNPGEYIHLKAKPSGMNLKGRVVGRASVIIE